MHVLFKEKALLVLETTALRVEGEKYLQDSL